VTIQGRKHTYLGIITDSGIQPNEQEIRGLVSPHISSIIKKILIETSSDILRKQWIEVALIAQSCGGEATLADTMPSFSSYLINTSETEIKKFFGSEDKKTYWNIGYPKVPKEIDVEVPVDVEKLINLSFGIFGKSGTGKTFLGNILAGYIILYDLLRRSDEKRIKLLIFDMHSEYALELKDNMGNPIEDGVAKIFSQYFIRYTPDSEYAERRGLRLLRINYNDLTIDDLRLIGPILGISETFLSHLHSYRYILSDKLKLGRNWIWGLLIDENTINTLEKNPEGRKIIDILHQRFSNISALRRETLGVIKATLGSGAAHSFASQTSKLQRLLSYPFTISDNPIEEIIDNLLRRDGSHITISLGKWEKETPLYMIIANLIARRLRQRILEKSKRGEELETKIIIFLEEAHNFLGKETYRLSPFGDVAREMRKKGVILCVIDQRPSELDLDVISMLWTKIVFALTERKDIETAVLGIPRAELFRKVLPILRSQEILIYGEAVRFPIVAKVKNYKDIALLFKNISEEKMQKLKQKEEIFSENGLL